MSSESTVLSVQGLQKSFHIGFFRKRVDAVRGIDYEVRQGEIFGLLGPNGAGKTTTIKMVLRLIFPSAGQIRLFGKPNSDPQSMRRLGYMPENPYVYQYLKPLEFLDLCGRLMDLPGKERRRRAGALIERVGLAHATDRPIGRFSKGMMQRIGLAQALLHDPELLVLDEPMSGLDPIGRKEIRDVLLEQREAGKTLLFTSHILSDVEMLCDRVVIMNRGKITARGLMDELLRPDVRRTHVELSGVGSELRSALLEEGTIIQETRDKLTLLVEGDHSVNPLLKRAIDAGAQVLSVAPERETLEDLFVRNAVTTTDASNTASQGQTPR
jgi:ABC-2 type transport system ATP-binding protein